MSVTVIFQQLPANRVGRIGPPVFPVYDVVEITLFSPFGVLCVEPVLQSELVSVNIKADVDFTYKAVAVRECRRELYCAHGDNAVRSDGDFVQRPKGWVVNRAALHRVVRDDRPAFLLHCCRISENMTDSIPAR